jgi:hypothetical protein
MALVRIDSILGYGSAFLVPLAVGQSVAVRFDVPPPDTAGSTPPGRLTALRPGEKFRADLEEPGETLPGAVARRAYQVRSFQRISTR